MTASSRQSLSHIAATELKGVGAKLAGKLLGLGISTVADVLFHLPFRYQDRTKLTPIGALQMYDDVVIEGVVRKADIAFGRRRSLVVRIEDDTGLATLRFFHFSASQKKQFVEGSRIRCFGEARRGSSGLEFAHPEYTVLSSSNTSPLPKTLTPIYPSSEGLQQKTWQKLVQQALLLLQSGSVSDNFSQHCPSPILLAEALHYLHNPPVEADLAQLKAGQHPCQQRLAFEELTAHRVSLLKVRHAIKHHAAPALQHNNDKEQLFLNSLPFTPTAAQLRVANEISKDLVQTSPMLRLVQGDVGSGKTLVAAMAALQAIASGAQVALMAPTEILAEQHLLNFSAWFEPLGIRVGWLVGKLTAKQKREQLALIANGDYHIVIGTHALFQKGVEFNQLGLVIVDEQHRFGVHQRLQLKEKGDADSTPHQLIMTATPIPRTLAMTAYADLDVSVIDELPPGRLPVQTSLIADDRRDAIVRRLADNCAKGHQAYWVCTMIDESETLQAQAAEVVSEQLREQLPNLSVGLVHGRLKPADKAEQMQLFKSNDTKLLVATTVIEVGVDVPNANIMIIENPERLGLAQLHQLRGRVGRGSAQSHCVLLYQQPLSRTAQERLCALRDSNDGFFIAQKDLEIRGPGEILGTQQTGIAQFKIADLLRDEHLLDEVKQAAEAIQYDTALVEQLIQRWLPMGDQFAMV